MDPRWQWQRANRAYGNYGNANQWTVGSGFESLARESAQNSNDARLSRDETSELVYTFIRLGPEARSRFEAAVGWPILVEHLGAMADVATSAVAAGQIKAGVEALGESHDLLLLQVSDYGCKGLTGPEFPDDETPEDEFGNFIKLCRLDLFSGKDKAAGGSFGLGKAVYWRFSWLQTVLFNSRLRAEDAVQGKVANRVFGVNQGVRHKVNGKTFEGRGFFGACQAEEADVESLWASDELVEALHLDRKDSRPGTTALLIGFYDPDQPDRGQAGGDGLLEVARALRSGIEENFWPLLTRGRMKVSVVVVDDGEVLMDEIVDPEDQYTELVKALRRFDAGDVDDKLEGEYSMVVRDIPIQVSQRVDGLQDHPPFEHRAKLVVTLSDGVADSLENQVCLLRQPEMVVQRIHREYESTFHAFLLAGASINPASATENDLRADDFLRFAEPPAHDQWIPAGSSQANLNGRYRAPWIPNLKAIEDEVAKALFELLGSPVNVADKGPEAILKHLRFLPGDPGDRGVGVGPKAGPSITLTDWKVVDGCWDVVFSVNAPNRAEGWKLDPRLKFVGLDGKGQTVEWQKIEVVSDGEVVDERSTVFVKPKPRKRRVTSVFKGRSVVDLPIPAEEAAIDVLVGKVHPLPAVREDGQ